MPESADATAAKARLVETIAWNIDRLVNLDVSGYGVIAELYQAALDHYSLPARYYAWSVPPERLEAEVSKLRGPEYLGANVTAPHKPSRIPRSRLARLR